jgi:flagellar biosynthetic protein FliR
MEPELVDAASRALQRLFGPLEEIAALGEAPVYALMAVFVRVGAVVALLPGFGERTLPARVKLAAAIAFALIVWPAVMPLARAAEADGPLAGGAPGPLAYALLAEAAVGLMLGIAARLMVMALQLAGSIAAQATSVSQIGGAQVTPDPMPAIGGILVTGGIALALALGLHVKAAILLIESYRIAPLGEFPLASDAAEWGVARVADAFGLAVSLAAPFAVASFAYNVALGAINRAMPQLMVAFVGAPAITAGALLLLWISGPDMLSHWAERLDVALADPFRAP